MAEGRAADGERGPVFDDLVRRNRMACERLARRLTGDAQDAEDLLQETLVDAYRSFHRFQANSHFYSWVARIMTNNHLDRVRRKRHPVVSLEAAPGEEAMELPDEAANPERIVLHGQLDGPFQSALEALLPIHRAAVLLCDVDGATYEEAAQAEACPVGTIRSRLHRAHKALRTFLSGLERDEPPVGADAALHSRRAFLRMGTAAAAGVALSQVDPADAAPPAPLRVLVWMDRQGATPDDGVRETLVAGLRADRRLEVRAASTDDPSHGLSDAELGGADVLVWWSDASDCRLPPERAAAVARRVRDGKLGLAALHLPAAQEPLRSLLRIDHAPESGAASEARASEDGSIHLRVAAPRHPVVRGVAGFDIPHVPASSGPAPSPDVVLLDCASLQGGRAWQGVVWTIGRGRVFHFRPGPLPASSYQQDDVRRLLRNAVMWCGGRDA